MISVALYEPEIPPNTGNIARLCAATQTPLHIVGQPGFRMDDRTVRRAGLDYWPHVNLHRHANLDALSAALDAEISKASEDPAAAGNIAAVEDLAAVGAKPRIVCLTTKATRLYTDWEFQENDCLLFGPETRGLPADILEKYEPNCLTIPMASEHVRSLNLANAVSIVLYEAIRQREKNGGKVEGRK